MTAPTYLGLDIGGSSTRARLRSGSAVRDVTGPGANIATLEPRVVGDRLTALLVQLGDAQPAAACAGAAGAEVPGRGERLRALIERAYPGCRVSVVHDTRLVLAAAELDAGIAVVAGTGSVAYARTAEGVEARRGGWGWMVGDEGSGVWIAREAARAVMRRADDGSDLGALGDELMKACSAGDPLQMIEALHSMHEAARWASLAQVVLATAAHDPGSRDILQRAAGELARLVAPLRSLCPDGPVVLAGGLLVNSPMFEDMVRSAIGMPCLRLEGEPVEGAVRLARALAGDSAALSSTRRHVE